MKLADCMIKLVLVSLAFVLTYEVKAEVLPLKGSSSTVPMFSEILRDPVFVKKRIYDELTAETALDRYNESVKSLRGQKGKAKARTLKAILDEAVLLVYYTEDLALGRIQTTGGSKKFKISLRQARTNLARYAGQLSKEKSASRSVRATAQFHASVANYMLGRQQSKNVKDLKNVKGLNGFLSRRRSFLVSWHSIRIGNSKQGEQGARTIAGLISGFPRTASISMRLIVGRYYAGVSTRGRKYKASDKRYRGYLWTAAQRAKKLTEEEQKSVLGFIAQVWRQAEGRSINWNNPPYKLTLYSDSPVTLAIVERAARQDVSKGQISKGVKKYDLLAKNFEGTIRTKAFDDAKVATLERQYRKSKDSRSYEASLRDAQQKYSDPGVMGEGREKSVASAKARFDAKLKQLVSREIAAAKRKGSPKVQRRQAIAMANRMASSSDDINTKEKYASEVGAIHQAHREHKEAVAAYMDLALNGQEKNKTKYYEKAIYSQTSLAKWSQKTPWQGFGKGPVQDRIELAGMYEQLDGLYGEKSNWRIKGQLGLLHLATGDKSKAIALWQPAIDSLPPSVDAGHASGFLLNEFEDSKNWAELEKTARVVIKRKIPARSFKKKLNAHYYLATALLEGGKQQLESGEPKVAVAKLEEFTKRYKKNSRHDEGFFHLSLAYHKNKQFSKAISTAQSFVETYPKSQYHKSAMLNGGNWSLASAREETVLYFYQGFVLRYNNESEAQDVRETLVDLYLGKQLYRQASQVHIRTTEAKNIDSQIKRDADFERMNLQAQFGSASSAVGIANQLIKKYRSDDEMLVRAYGIKATASAQKGDYKSYLSHRKQMEARDTSSTESQELLGGVRYLGARMIAEKLRRGEIDSLSMRQPLKEMNKAFAEFTKAKKGYDSVCQGITSSYCAGAMYDLARLSEQTSVQFEDYRISSGLDNKSINAFESRKSEILKTLSRTALYADGRAKKEAVEGNTQPSHVRQVLWFHTSDWNFEGDGTEFGHGFVQWKTRS